MGKDSSFSPYELRMGILYGAIIICVFGFLDPYMLPLHFRLAWILRYAVFAPFLVLIFILSFSPRFIRSSRFPTFLLLLAGQMMMLALVAISTPTEPAYVHYFLGLLIVLLWTGFVSRFGFKENLILFIATIVSLNIIYLLVQHSFSAENRNLEIGRVLGSNILLLSSGAIILNGNYRMEKFKNRLEKEIVISNLAKEKAEESSRLKTAFLTNMSHEIRTPLNGMIGFADMLQHRDISPYKRNLYLEFIQRGGHQLLNVINDIMDFSKLESNQLKLNMDHFSIGKLLFERVDYFREHINLYTKCQIEIALDISPLFLNKIIHSDKKRFTQILDNLISNALKYSEKGKVTVGISVLKSDKNNMVLFVKDNGIGIDKKNFEFIFQSFKKIEKKQFSSGNGLGLSITKNLTELMGGKIFLESEPNIGSTFYVSLPIQWDE